MRKWGAALLAAVLALTLVGCQSGRYRRAVRTLKDSLKVSFRASKSKENGESVFYFTDQNGVEFTYDWRGDSFAHASWSCDYGEAWVESYLDSIAEILESEGLVNQEELLCVGGACRLTVVGAENREALGWAVYRILEETPEIPMETENGVSLHITIPYLSVRLEDQEGQRLAGGRYPFYCQGQAHRSEDEIAEDL